MIVQVMLIVLSSVIRLVTSSVLSDLIRTLHPRLHSPHHVSYTLCDLQCCRSYLRTEWFHHNLEPVVHLQHDPSDSSLQKRPLSHLPPKTSTCLRHRVAEEGRLQPTRVDYLRPPEATLCCQSHSPNCLQIPHQKIHRPTGGYQGHVEGSTLRL